MDKKKAAKLDYKENPPEMGVLQVRNKVTGNSVIFAAANLAGKINCVTFQLEAGSFIERGFQQAYDAGSPTDIEFNVLQVLKPEKSPGYNYKADLKLLAEAWKDKV